MPALLEPQTTLMQVKPPEDTTVLIVEDNAIIALDVEDILRQLGIATVLVESQVASALRRIEAEAISLAIIDIKIGESTGFPVAERLKTLGIPFVFASGYGADTILPVVFHGTTIIAKPFSEEGMATVLELLNRS